MLITITQLLLKASFFENQKKTSLNRTLNNELTVSSLGPTDPKYLAILK